MTSALQVTWADRPPDSDTRYSRAAEYDATRAKMEKAMGNGGAHRSALRFPLGTAARFPEKFYVSSDGRTWEEVNAEPRAENFGGPAYVPYPRLHHDLRFNGRGRLKAQQVREDTEDLAAWHLASDAHEAAYELWRGTEGYNAYIVACDRHSERSAQFSYTGRARQDKATLAALAPNVA